LVRASRNESYPAGDEVADDEDLQGIRANADMVVEQLGTASGLERFGFDAPTNVQCRQKQAPVE
jgi:hypothetical protein